MNEKEFADIEYSKKLGHLFQDADYWWVYIAFLGIWKPVPVIHRSVTEQRYPAITIQMALDKIHENKDLPEINMHIFKNETWAGFPFKKRNHLFCSDRTIDVLCKMIEYLEENK